MELFYLNTQLIFPWLFLLTCTVLPWKGFFLSPSLLNFLKVFKYQEGWAGAIGKVVARKFVTHPFLPFTRAVQKLITNPLSAPAHPPPLYLLTSPLIEIQSFLIIITDTSLNILKFNKLLVEGSLKSRQQQSKYLKQCQTCLLG